MTTSERAPSASPARLSTPTPAARPCGAAVGIPNVRCARSVEDHARSEQLADAIMIPILFTVMFTYLFGRTNRLDTGLPPVPAPGTMVFAVLLITVYAGVNLNADITKGLIDRFRSMTIWRPAQIVGGLISDAGRNLLAASLVIALGLVMGIRTDGPVGCRHSSTPTRSAISWTPYED